MLPLPSFLFKARPQFCLVLLLQFFSDVAQSWAILGLSSHFCLSCRLESQMTADIQAILQLLQKQTTAVPPAYSVVTAGGEYQRPAIRLMRASHPGASIKTDRSFSPSSQVSRGVCNKERLSRSVSRDHLNQNRVTRAAVRNACSHFHPCLYSMRTSGNEPCNLCFNQASLHPTHSPQFFCSFKAWEQWT